MISELRTDIVRLTAISGIAVFGLITACDSPSRDATTQTYRGDAKTLDGEFEYPSDWVAWVRDGDNHYRIVVENSEAAAARSLALDQYLDHYINPRFISIERYSAQSAGRRTLTGAIGTDAAAYIDYKEASTRLPLSEGRVRPEGIERRSIEVGGLPAIFLKGRWRALGSTFPPRPTSPAARVAVDRDEDLYLIELFSLDEHWNDDLQALTKVHHKPLSIVSRGVCV